MVAISPIDPGNGNTLFSGVREGVERGEGARGPNLSLMMVGLIMVGLPGEDLPTEVETIFGRLNKVEIAKDQGKGSLSGRGEGWDVFVKCSIGYESCGNRCKSGKGVSFREDQLEQGGPNDQGHTQSTAPK